jgi:serine phosphatase RsbU (regulator of sigma subunit)
MDRLEALVLANRDKSAVEIITALEWAVQAFTGSAPIFDDITLLVARRTE